MLLSLAQAVRQYLPPLLLLCLAVAFGVAAWVALPRESPIYQPAAFDILVDTSERVERIEIDVVRWGSKHDDVSIGVDVTTDAPARPAQDVSGHVALSLPRGVKIPACSEQFCHHPLGGDTLVFLTLNFSSTGTLPPYFSSPEGPKRAARVTQSFNAQQFAWDANGVSAVVQLPSVHLRNERSRGGSDAPLVLVTYYLRPAGYDWTGGPRPTLTHTDSVSWVQALPALTNPVLVSATNPAAQQHAAFMTFFAGALVGVAGGGLIGAVQEAIHLRHESPGGERQRPLSTRRNRRTSATRRG
jgi:hypothetical protein